MYVQDLIDELENYHPDTQVFVKYGARTCFPVTGISADVMDEADTDISVRGIILWMNDDCPWFPKHDPIDSTNGPNEA
jgi:hypothetical protein